MGFSLFLLNFKNFIYLKVIFLEFLTNYKMLIKVFRLFANEVNAGKASSILQGKMKNIEVNGDKNAILVYNDKGNFYATGGKCSHYGAPLVTGVFVQGKVYCPWHCACFDVKTGDKDTSPGLQDIPTYPTTINNAGDLIVSIDENIKEPANYVNRNYTTWDKNNKQRFVIIGGGAAGQACAETLRKNEFTGEILILTNENINPYDRVTLSKNFKMNAQKTVLKNDEFYDTYGIQVRKNTSVKKINEETNTVEVNEGEKISFDKLLIASGSSARILQAYQEASKLSNVFSIRSVEDHEKIKPLVQTGTNIVIIGGSFLGLESANSIKSAFPEKNVTVIELEQVPLQRIMGTHIGSLLQRQAELKGIKFILGTSAQSINFNGSKASSVSVGSSELPADLVLLATGATINTSFVPEKLLNEDRSVRVNGLLQTDNRDIFAAGDVATFPSIHTGKPTRIEHWAVAQDQGIHAAYNMLGQGKYYTNTPFF